MVFFNKKQRNEERSYQVGTLETLLSNNSGYINKQIVEKIPVVMESVKKICGTVASLPIEIIEKELDKNTILNKDTRLFLMNIEANDYETAYNFKYKITEDLLLYGKHYSYIKRKGVNIEGLYPINFETVGEQDIVDSDGIIIDKKISYTLNNITCIRSIYEILVIDSNNKGILNSSKLLNLILQHDNILESSMNNLIIPNGVLKASGRLTEQTINRMRDSWKNLYQGTGNAGKTIILEEGLDYKPITSVNLNDIQSIDNKKAFDNDVQRLFNLYNIQSDKDYLKYTITPLISCIENALNQQLLLTKEKENNLSFRFDTEMVDRLNEKDRVEAISMALDKGIYTINEARLRLDMNPFLLNNEEQFLSLSMGKVMLMQDGKLILPNMGTGLDINNIETENNVLNNNDKIKEDITDGATV